MFAVVLLGLISVMALVIARVVDRERLWPELADEDERLQT
jgi:hypothetical protein